MRSKVRLVQVTSIPSTYYAIYSCIILYISVSLCLMNLFPICERIKNK